MPTSYPTLVDICPPLILPDCLERLSILPVCPACHPSSVSRLPSFQCVLLPPSPLPDPRPVPEASEPTSPAFYYFPPPGARRLLSGEIPTFILLDSELPRTAFFHACYPSSLSYCFPLLFWTPLPPEAYEPTSPVVYYSPPPGAKRLLSGHICPPLILP